MLWIESLCRTWSKITHLVMRKGIQIHVNHYGSEFHSFFFVCKCVLYPTVPGLTVNASFTRAFRILTEKCRPSGTVVLFYRNVSLHNDTRGLVKYELSFGKKEKRKRSAKFILKVARRSSCYDDCRQGRLEFTKHFD